MYVKYFKVFWLHFAPIFVSLARRAIRTAFARDSLMGTKTPKVLQTHYKSFFPRVLKAGRETFGIFDANCSISREDSANSTASER